MPVSFCAGAGGETRLAAALFASLPAPVWAGVSVVLGSATWGVPRACRGALAVLFELVSNINRGQIQDAALLKALAATLGLLQAVPREYLQSRSGVDEAFVQARIDARVAAKKARDFQLADRIRDEMAALGIELKDGPKGTTWVRA